MHHVLRYKVFTEKERKVGKIMDYRLVVEAPGLLPHLRKTFIGSKLLSNEDWEKTENIGRVPVYLLYVKDNAVTSLSPNELAEVLNALLSPNDCDMVFLDNMSAIARVRRLNGTKSENTPSKCRIVRPPPFTTKLLDRTKEVIPQRNRNDDGVGLSTGVAVAVGVIGIGIALAVVSVAGSTGSDNGDQKARDNTQPKVYQKP